MEILIFDTHDLLIPAFRQSSLMISMFSHQGTLLCPIYLDDLMENNVTCFGSCGLPISFPTARYAVMTKLISIQWDLHPLCTIYFLACVFTPIGPACITPVPPTSTHHCLPLYEIYHFYYVNTNV